VSVHSDAAAFLCVTEAGLHHRKHPADLQCKRKIYDAFLAPLRTDGIAKLVFFGDPAHNSVGEPEALLGRLVHRTRVTAENRLDVVLWHTRFERQVDGELREGPQSSAKAPTILAANLACVGTTRGGQTPS
jgi:hypothetical protein